MGGYASQTKADWSGDGCIVTLSNEHGEQSASLSKLECDFDFNFVSRSNQSLQSGNGIASVVVQNANDEPSLLVYKRQWNQIRLVKKIE